MLKGICRQAIFSLLLATMLLVGCGSQQPAHGATGALKVSGIEAPNIVHKVATIADLRQMIGNPGRQAVQVTGYHVPGDGGGGPLRRWDASSTCPDDNFACIDPDPVAVEPGRWVITDGMQKASILAAGAQAGTDVTSALNSLLQWAEQVSFPSGFAGTIGSLDVPSNRTFRGEKVILTVTGTTTFSQVENISFSGITFSGSEMTTVFMTDRVENLSFVNCVFDDSRIRPVTDTDFSKNIKFSFCTFIATSFSEVRSVYTNCDGIYIEDCLFQGENIYEFLKITGNDRSGRAVIRRNKFVGSTQEEIVDAYTCLGPFFFEDNIIQTTGGGVVAFKAEGGAGPNVAWPELAVIKNNTVVTSEGSTSQFYFGGARTLPWEGNPQTVIFKGNKIKLDTPINGYRVLDIRGIHIAEVEGNEINAASVPTFLHSIYVFGGVGAVNIRQNHFGAGGVGSGIGPTPNGTTYGGNNYINISDNVFKKFKTGAWVYFSEDSANVKFLNNDIYINSSDVGENTTRPVNREGIASVKSIVAAGNTVEIDAIQAPGAGITPLFHSADVLRLNIGNSWQKKINYSSAAPTSGTYARGDVVMNSVPSEAGTAGSRYVIDKWICISDGSPGIWRESRVLTGN